MKVNEAKNKSAFLPWTTFPMCAERISESKATDTEIQLSLSCVLDCIYSLALTFCTGGVLYLTPTSTHAAVAFQVTKAYHHHFHSAVESNKLSPCGHFMF